MWLFLRYAKEIKSAKLKTVLVLQSQWMGITVIRKKRYCKVRPWSRVTFSVDWFVKRVVIQLLCVQEWSICNVTVGCGWLKGFDFIQKSKSLYFEFDWERTTSQRQSLAYMLSKVTSIHTMVIVLGAYTACAELVLIWFGSNTLHAISVLLSRHCVQLGHSEVLWYFVGN